MGLRDWLSGKASDRARVPGKEAPPREVIHYWMRNYLEDEDKERWVSLHASGADKKATVQFVESELNFCKEKVDLASLLAGLGLVELARSAKPGGRRGDDHTTWTLPNATAEELTEIVHAAFVDPLGLGEDYRVEGER